MAQDDSTNDIVLTSQMAAEFDDEGFEHNEEILAYCINSMILAGSDILSDIHAHSFQSKMKSKKKVPEITFESCKENLEEVVMYLFCILNKLMVDAPLYSEVMEIRDSIPVMARADKTLTIIALVQSVTDLSTMIWQDLDSGNSNIMQVMLKNNAAELEEEMTELEEDVVSVAGAILALVDTMCQHTGQSLRAVL
jgi:hypothetical protein